MKRFPNLLGLAVTITALFLASTALSQTTEFTYQGHLKDNSQAANGNYDFEFALFDALEGGSQIGPTLTRTAVPVSEGAFSVNLDFGGHFPGAARYLEIRVAPSAAMRSGETLLPTVLSPRQMVMTTPYAMKSLNADNATSSTNAAQLNGVEAAQYVLTTDPRMTDARPPTAGSGDYIQNKTTQQASSNFSISGTGRATVFDAGAHFSIGGNQVLGISGTATYPNSNTFTGVGAGQSNTGGYRNSFFGNGAGFANTTGTENSFFGWGAGLSNTEGVSNAFFGRSAGSANTTGDTNSFFGYYSGYKNTEGARNSFFGSSAGYNNTTGSYNSFFGTAAGQANTTGSYNAFFGRSAGATNTTGYRNSFFGYWAGYANTEGNHNSFFGHYAGRQNTTGGSNSFFGYQAGYLSTTGNENSLFGPQAGYSNTTGNYNSFYGPQAGYSNITGSGNTALGVGTNFGAGDLTNATAIGARAYVTQSDSLVLGSIDGVNNAISSTSVGIGTSAPNNPLTVTGNGTANGGVTGYGEVSARFRNALVWHSAISIDSETGYDSILYLAEDSAAKWGIRNDAGTGNFQIRYHADGVNSIRLAINTGGYVVIPSLGSAGSTSLCVNASYEISTCSSSVRYKSNIEEFSAGIKLVEKLRPVSFNWKGSGMADLGLVAEEVAEIEPLLVTYRNGEVEGVKYDRLGVMLINVVKEQQKTIEKQQDQINALKALVCATNKNAQLCRPESDVVN